MADAAARREARRRKILENSEYRLQRITGQANHKQQLDDQTKSIATEVPHKSFNSTVNGGLAKEALIGNQSLDALINELNADINAEESTTQSCYEAENDLFALLSKPNVPHRRNTGHANTSAENGNTAGSMKPDTTDDVGFSPDRRNSTSENSLANGDIDNRNTNVDVEPSSMNFLLSSRLIYVALAIVVNIMVIWKLEHLFGMTIIIPFILTMIGRLFICKNTEDSQSSNMLIAALILSNVRPDLVKMIHRLKGSFSLSNRILQDFAVYMFTFVLIHTVLCRYWMDLDYASPISDQ